MQTCCILIAGTYRTTHLFEIHLLHSAVHAFHYVCHTTRDLTHRHSRLHSASDSIDPAGQPQQIQLLILLANGILSVDLGDVAVVLLDRLLELCFFARLVLAGFGGLSVQLLCGEL